MSESDDSTEVRSVPTLYWFADEHDNAVLFAITTETREAYELFAFFTSEQLAQTYRDQSTMEAKWILNSSEDADELIRLCENNAHFDAFIFDSPAIQGSVGQPVRLSEVKEIIEDNVGHDSWDLGF